ncbi:hypothetical protein ACWTQY_32290, partial [Klebsiella pneumoniae]
HLATPDVGIPQHAFPVLGIIALLLKTVEKWYADHRTFYSQREKQRYLLDQAIQRAHYRMHSFY